MQFVAQAYIDSYMQPVVSFASVENVPFSHIRYAAATGRRKLPFQDKVKSFPMNKSSKPNPGIRDLHYLFFGFPRCLRTRASSSFRSSGVSFSHRICASPTANKFLGAAFFSGPQRASAAAFIIELRFSGDTLAHRFFAPFRPPTLCRLLTGFSLDKSRV